MEQSVVIIGYGTAAVNALVSLRSNGYNGRVTVCSETDMPPYSPVLISHYAGGVFSLGQCQPWSGNLLSALDATVLPSSPVTDVDLGAHIVHTSRADIPYDKCLVASGSSAVRAGIPTIEGYEPLPLRTLDDAERLRERFEEGSSRILVSGSSMIALKAVEACLDRNVETTLLGRSGHILRTSALPEIAAELENGLQGYGVDLLLGDRIEAASVTDGGIDVSFSSGTHGMFDEIVVAHGVTPNLGFIRERTLEIDRGLLVDDFMRTSDPDVLAAGDVAQAFDPSTGSKRIIGLWKSACIQGARAGKTIAEELGGAPLSPLTAAEKMVPHNSITVKGTVFISGGCVEMRDGRGVRTRRHGGMTVAEVLEGDRLTGFNVLSDDATPRSDAYDEGAMCLRRLTEHLV